jgi:hypothetical protein
MSEERVGVYGIIDLMNKIHMNKPLTEAEDMGTQWDNLARRGMSLNECDLADALLDMYWSARTTGGVTLDSNAFAKTHNILRERGLLGGGR